MVVSSDLTVLSMCLGMTKLCHSYHRFWSKNLHRSTSFSKVNLNALFCLCDLIFKWIYCFRKTYHLPCGLKNGVQIEFLEGFKSFCIEHRHSQVRIPYPNTNMHWFNMISNPTCRRSILTLSFYKLIMFLIEKYFHKRIFHPYRFFFLEGWPIHVIY